MGEALKHGLKISDNNVWFSAPCPVVFFAFADKFQEEDRRGYTIRDFLLNEARVLEIGNVDKTSSGLVYCDIFANGYIVRVEFDDDNHNLGIVGIFTAGIKQKRAFIENDVKLVNISEQGIIFSRIIDGQRAHDVAPLQLADKMKTKYNLRYNDNMPRDGYEALKEYVLTETEKPDKEEFEFNAEYFDEKYLQTVTAYAKAEQDMEQEKADATRPITYYSRKSVKHSGDKRKRYLYEFVCEDYDTDAYTTGSEVFVALSFGEMRGRIAETGELQDASRIMVVSFKDQFSEAALPASGGIIRKAANQCQKLVRDFVVEKFRNGEVNSMYMLKAFNNPDAIDTEPFDDTIDTEPIIDEIREKRSPLLNDMQQKAIEAGIKSKDLALVLGPPGTGKTTIIVEWALYYMRQRKRVLISSKNNKAVDNAFDRIADYMDKYPEFKDLVIARVGNAEKVQANVVPYMLENQHQKMQDKILANSDKWHRIISSTLALIDNATSVIEEEKESFERAFSLKEQLADYYAKIKEQLNIAASLGAEIAAEEIRVAKQLADLAKAKEDFAAKAIYLQEDARKNLLARLFHMRETRWVRKEYTRLESYVRNFRLVDNSPALVGLYNTAIAELIALLGNGDFVRVKTEYANLEEYLTSKPDITITTDLPFDNITYKFSTNKSELEAFDAAVVTLEDKTKQIRTVLSDWHTNVSEKDNTVLTNLLASHLSVVGATCIGINTNRDVQDLDFDVAIIDEAGQIQIHDAIVPMSRATRTLMLGDHKQIPPSVDRELLEHCDNEGIDTSLLKKSFFEYLFEQKGLPDRNKVLLNTQFRMPEEVADIISTWFYNKKYKTTGKKKKGVMPLLLPEVFKSPLVIIDTSDQSDDVRREVTEYDRESNKKSRYNPCEARIIAKVLQKIDILSPECKVKLGDIGVISALKRQKEEIQFVVRKEFPHLSRSNIEAMIATLDSFQGQEREIIIYSCTRSNDRNEIGFLNELRRLNVALSRCKSQIVIIGDFDFLTTCTDALDDDDEEIREEFNEVVYDDVDIEETNNDEADDYDDDYDFDDDYDYDEDDQEEEEESQKRFTLPLTAPPIFGFAKKKEHISPDSSDNSSKEEFTSPELDNSVQSFSNFMSFLLTEVKKGNGEYIKSKDFE